MPAPWPDTLLAQLADLVAGQLGLHFTPQRWPDLERGLRAAAAELGFADVAVYGQWLISTQWSRPQRDLLASHLTVGETYFFREKQVMAALQEHVLPELLRARRGTGRPLRIWSAGCCTGEEAYSIAILLNQLLPNPPDPGYTILATDINPLFLRKAQAGVYSEWSFRDTPAWVREHYFKPTATGQWEVLPRIRRSVTFAPLNLAQDLYPALQTNTNALDLIFCRNVLMYLTPALTKRVVHQFQQALVEGGWLVVSPTEVSHVTFAEFTTVNFPQVILYQKDSRRPPVTPRPQPVTLAPPLLEFQPEPAGAPDTASLPAPAPTPALAAVAPLVDHCAEAARLFDQGRYAEAETAAQACLASEPACAPAMALLARLYANQGRLNEAQDWCQQAIAADRLNAGSHYLLAIIEQERGQLDEAAAALKRALYLEPDFVLAHYALGNLAQQRGKAPEAAKHFANTRALLNGFARDALLPESDGLTAGGLLAILSTTADQEKLA